MTCEVNELKSDEGRWTRGEARAGIRSLSLWTFRNFVPPGKNDSPPPPLVLEGLEKARS